MTQEERAELVTILNEKDYDALSLFEENPARLVSKLDADASYFLALHYIQAQNPSAARICFEYGAKNASALIAQKCRAELIHIGSPEKRLSAAVTYAKTYPDDPFAPLYVAREYASRNKYTDAIKADTVPSVTELASWYESLLPPERNLESPPSAASKQPGKTPQGATNDASNVNKSNQQGAPHDASKANDASKQRDASLRAANGLMAIHILSLARLKDRSCIDYIEEWFLQWQISTEHVDFVTAWNELPPDTLDFLHKSGGERLTELEAIMQFRALVFEKKYGAARQLEDSVSPELLRKNPPLLSDYGRALLFGGADSKKAAATFADFTAANETAYGEFLAWFYNARFLVKSGEIDAGLSSYRRAMQVAPRGENYDNALWYYLDTVKKVSFTAVLQALRAYAPTWYDAEYFQDFFFSLSADLLSYERWDDFVDVYATVLPYADNETCGQYAYICGRLLSEGLAKNPFLDQTTESVIRSAFTYAYQDNHTTLYYRVLAAKQLGLPVESALSIVSYDEESASERDKNAEKLVLGYAEYGFTEKILSAYNEYRASIGLKAAITLAQKLKDAGEYSQSLRLITYASRDADVPLTREVLELLYPRPYYDEVKTAANEFDVSEDVLYGLLRTESFFDRTVYSVAGAVGLAQLMEATAADIAKRLKVTEYDLHDAATNVRFGAYYIDNLIERLDGSVMLALFSYNGGITRVRRWVKAAQDLPIDLFLETVPFAETRDYGRKVLAAASIYGYLYYGKTVEQVVQEVLR